MVKTVRAKHLVLVVFVLCAFVRAAAAQPPPAAPAATPPQEEGIPIQNDLVKSKCGGCHRSDDKGRMTRISYRRASPENWEKTIKRMVTLNNVRLEPADARNILKYLSDHNGLAPEEVRPIFFEMERRMVEYSYTADKLTADTCSSCHTMARVLSERRTKEEWELLIAMHRGYYPLVDNQPMNGGQGFRRTRPQQTEPGEDGRPPDNRHPMERALEHLSKTYPLNTPTWASWSAAMQPAKLAGRWAVSGYQAGKGPVVGQVVITADPAAPDNFNVETRYILARTGETISRTGKAVVYTGFQWRGRSGAAGSDNVWRESMIVERDWREMSGRWFSGAYDETGIDVKMVRLGSDPLVFGPDLPALKTGSNARPLKIYGANLPASVRAEDIGLGQGVRIARVVSAKPEEIQLEVDVAATAPIGPRDLSIAGSVKPAALMVYDRIDGIKVLPQAGMARVGGVVFPKQLQQFEAIGTHNGPDGKPGTDDDLNLGIVDVKWSVEEYTATFGDDDTQFVGALDDKGLFTPNVDGPNPRRSGNRNNVGDVWIVAEYIPPPGTPAPPKPIRARAHLLVTVPLYMAWFQTGGGQ